jgi:2,3,4,5-tetrahydropyridine-2-carboxylate N-succinyltransferase
VTLKQLEARINELAAVADPKKVKRKAASAVKELLDALEEGEARAAYRDERTGEWRANAWVKRGILLGFRISELADMSVPRGIRPRLSFVDKELYTTQNFTVADGVRIVPGGSTIRRGAYVAKGVVCMPPMYINVGAYVATGTMVDSHALVGSCAQIGERVHISAAAQIGGVLEPVNANPVVIEDDVLVGGNCGVYEGTIVRRKAVLASGVVLTRGTPVFDLPNQRVLKAEGGTPLEIPESAVVVPGARAVTAEWGAQQGLSLQTPVIVKYRDEKTDLATTLEAWLR